jgi:hypothetical protein
MNNEIGIGILDVYSEQDYEKCYNSIPEIYKNNIISVSNKTVQKNTQIKNFTNQVSFATLRNYALTQLRIKGFKYYFLINSNTSIKNEKLFEKCINLANTFGTWFLCGPSEKGNTIIEDDESDLFLDVTPILNTNFIFMYSSIVKNFGFFDERYYNTKNLDVLDYILKMRASKIYPPNNYNPTINILDVEKSNSTIEKIKYSELGEDSKNWDKSMEISLGYFQYKHKYIPTINDPQNVSQEALLEFMQKLQEQYANSKK